MKAPKAGAKQSDLLRFFAFKPASTASVAPSRSLPHKAQSTAPTAAVEDVVAEPAERQAAEDVREASAPPVNRASSVATTRARPAGKHEYTQLEPQVNCEARSSATTTRARPAGKQEYTQLEQQVVALKKENPGVLLLVEVGYKYRFFGEDAEIAAKVLNIYAHMDHAFMTASIPVYRLHVHIRRLVEAGHKVGVVKQAETAAIKASSEGRSHLFKRSLTALYTRATLHAGADLGGQGSLAVTEDSSAAVAGEDVDAGDRVSSYLFCIAEEPARVRAASSTPPPAARDQLPTDATLAVVAVDTATGDVLYDQFDDSVLRFGLQSILLTCPPAELLFAGPVGAPTENLIAALVTGKDAGVRIERFPRPGAGATAAVAAAFREPPGGEDGPAADCDADGSSAGPRRRLSAGLEEVMALPELVMATLAVAADYLKQFGLERLLRLSKSFKRFSDATHMTLTPNTLRQLEVLETSAGQTKGSLLWLLDQTRTAMGRRLLRKWVGHPLTSRELVEERLDAVDELATSLASSTDQGRTKGGSSSRSIAGSSVAGILQRLLGVLASPDLERGITRLFHRTATPAEFVAVLQSLVAAASLIRRSGLLHAREAAATACGGSPGPADRFDASPASAAVEGDDDDGDARAEAGQASRDDDESGGHVARAGSPLLRRLLRSVAGREVTQAATALLREVDVEAAAAGDKVRLLTCEGEDKFPEVTRWRGEVKKAEAHLKGLLVDLRRIVNKPTLQYCTVSGVEYLIELSPGQRVPSDWIKVSSTQRAHRYHPPDVTVGMERLNVARESLEAACGRAWGQLLAQCGQHYATFQGAVQAAAALDCLLSLARVAASHQGYVRPHFVEDSAEPQIMLEDARHPVLDVMLASAFVPNSCRLHAGGQRCVIITGPNMGGKSVYIRQVALITIMAQMGSFVPAASARLRVVDNVFTRMGASDSIQLGRSTFFEELAEASTILASATHRSLVILDELGRGTSTHDGVAIAFAALRHFLEATRCLTLFVTHYPVITSLQKEHPREVGAFFVSYVSSGPAPAPASCQGAQGYEVGAATQPQEEGEGSSVAPDQAISFLYKLVPGVADRSFGLHVARLAEIPPCVIDRAAIKAAELESTTKMRARKRKRASDAVDADLANAALDDTSEEQSCAVLPDSPTLERGVTVYKALSGSLAEVAQASLDDSAAAAKIQGVQQTCHLGVCLI
eukprot:jgi/Mesvir1/17793/Mv12900-RA.1